MKKIFLVFSIICFGLCSCRKPVYKEVDGGRQIRVVPNTSTRFNYIEFDGHEYLEYYDGLGHRGSVCHSPKCHCLTDSKE
jgi:hypothetical protein